MSEGKRLSSGTSLMLLISCLLSSATSIRYWIPSAISQLEYGIFFVFLSALLFIIGLRSYVAEKRNDLLRSLLLSMAPVWISLGTTHLCQAVDAIDIPVGKISFLAVYVCILVIAGLHTILSIVGQIGQIALLSTILTLVNVLEIVNAYGSSEHTFSVASLSMLYAVVSAYILSTEGIRYVKESRVVDKTKSSSMRKASPKVSSIMNGISASHLLTLVPFVILSIDSNINSCEVGIPVICGGIFQVVTGVSLLRHQQSFQSFLSCLYGVTWSSLGVSLLAGCWSDGVSATGSADIPSSIFVIISTTLVILLSVKSHIYDILFNSLFVVEMIALLTTGYNGKFFGVVSWFLAFAIVYKMLAYGIFIVLENMKVPLGQYDQILHEAMSCIRKLYCCYAHGSRNPIDNLQEEMNNSDVDDDLIGYSKYATLEMMGFLVNGIAAVSYLCINDKIMGIAWVIIAGGILQFIVGSVCYSRGKSFQSCVFLLYSMFWMVSGTSRGLLHMVTEKHAALALGPMAFMIVGVVLVGISLTISKAWTSFLVFMLLNPLIVMLDLLKADLSNEAEVPLIVLFCLSGLYCFLSLATKAWWGVSLVPEGKPFVNIMYGNDGSAKRVVMASSRTISGVKKIADILNSGGIVGIPTDTVYILCAACKHPQAVERAYNTKKQAEDRPMSMWISNIKQLESAYKALGPLQWKFMEKVWPSSISCVVPKGEWLQELGIGDSAKYVGRPDSIAVRLPDYTATTHLIDLVGPIAVTSANPSGEADTTHHSQVLARLGTQNVDGILCDGPSPENAASTVVDCRKINERQLGFFRVGITPKSRVEELFQEVLQQLDSEKDGGFQRVLNGTLYQQSVKRANSHNPDIVSALAETAVSAATYNAVELAHILHRTISGEDPEPASPAKNSHDGISRRKSSASKKRRLSSKKKSVNRENDKAPLTVDSDDTNSISSVQDNNTHEPAITEEINDLNNEATAGIDNVAYESESETDNNRISEKL